MEKGFFDDASVKFVVVLTHCEQGDEDRDRGETRDERGEERRNKTGQGMHCDSLMIIC
jgi:hypothetical protein